jgi:hypothetical protein
VKVKCLRSRSVARLPPLMMIMLASHMALAWALIERGPTGARSVRTKYGCKRRGRGAPQRYQRDCAKLCSPGHLRVAAERRPRRHVGAPSGPAAQERD